MRGQECALPLVHPHAGNKWELHRLDTRQSTEPSYIQESIENAHPETVSFRFLT